MTKNIFRPIAIACALAIGDLSLIAASPAMLTRGLQPVKNTIQKAEAETYDYEILDIPVLCNAIWYGSQMNWDKNDHKTQAFQTILGTKALGGDGMPQNESTVYSFLTYQTTPVDEKEPMPATGHYTMGDKEGDMIIENSAMIYKRDGNGNYEWNRKVTDGHLDITTTEEDGYTYWNYDLVLVDEAGKKHHVTYKSRFVEYDDQSQPYDTDILLKDLNVKVNTVRATYKKINDSNAMHVRVVLTDQHWDEEYQEFDHNYPATELYTEMYLPYSPEGFVNGEYKVAEEYGPEYTIQPGEIVEMAGVRFARGSYAQFIGANSDIHWGVYKSGKLTIAGEGDERTITAEFLTEEDYTVKFTYKGALSIMSMPDSGLTEDKTLDLTDAKATFEYYGDYYSYGGASTWFVKFSPTGDHKDGFQTELSSKSKYFKNGILSGTYTASRSTSLWPGEYAKGRKTETLLTGTWYMGEFDEEGLPHLYAPATSGDLNITNHNDGTYTVEFNFSDGLNHTWKGTWTGTPICEQKVQDPDDSAVDTIGADSGLTVEGLDVVLAGEQELRVADAQGRTVFAGRTSRLTLPSAGFYILTVDGKAFKVMAR